MSWVFTDLMKRTRNLERKQARRLDEAYAHWHKKHCEFPHSRDWKQERRLLGTSERDSNDHRKE